MKIWNLLVFLFFAIQISAQYETQKKGDYYFTESSYAKAIEEYKKMITKNHNTSYAHQQLAECYLLTRDFKKSLPHFKAIIDNPTLPIDYYFKYAMALYSDGQVELSEKYLKKYKQLKKNDTRVKRFSKDENVTSMEFN